MNVNNKEFLELLVKAKKGTYANSDAPKVIPSRLNSKDYEFTDGNFTYHDTYFGGVKFMGEEVVYYNDNILWGMNYYGITIDSSLTEEVMDKVLRVANLKNKTKFILGKNLKKGRLPLTPIKIKI